ncbi:MAG: hypothetical protein ACRDGW_08125 [Actinomycetota bacterium]
MHPIRALAARSGLAIVAALVVSTVPTAAVAEHSTEGTTSFNLQGPNTMENALGQQIAVTGAGAIYEAGHTATGGGGLVQTDAQGNVVARGRWAATTLLGFESGVITIEVTLSPGGAAKSMTIVCGATAGGVTLEGYAAQSGSTLCHDANDDLG